MRSNFGIFDFEENLAIFGKTKLICKQTEFLKEEKISKRKRKIVKMPTLILIDSSLSMLRPANRPPTLERTSESSELSRENDAFELMDLAKWGIDLLLGHIEKVYKMEHVAILSYGCQCDLVCPFTRDISELRAKITTIDSSDASNPIAGLKGS